jgi:hypothetical protein
MPYTDRFIPTDSLIPHLTGVTSGILDPRLKANYAGFLSVSAVTVYELAIKDIFEEFAQKKHNIFGYYIQTHFEKINGRIKIDSLRNDHIKGFGPRYVAKFNRELDRRENSLFSAHRISIKNCYGNLIVCRHEYVHQGNPTLTFSEVVTNYNYGKEIIHSLEIAMRR